MYIRRHGMRYTLLLIDLLLLALPVALSFLPGFRFVRFWKYLIPAFIVSLVLILPIEYFFSSWGVWKWNPAYLSGAKLATLPFEVILYYIAMPLASVWLYEFARQKYLRDHARPYSKLISFGVALLSIFLLILLNRDLYSAIVLCFTAFMLLLHSFVLKTGKMGRFYLGFPFMLIIFLPLRLAITSLKMISYDNAEISSIYLFRMPVEDILFHFMHMLIFVTVYESSIGDRTKFKAQLPALDEAQPAAPLPHSPTPSPRDRGRIET